MNSQFKRQISQLFAPGRDPYNTADTKTPAVPDLLNVARNAAGIDERWLANASREQLLAALAELRRDARNALNK